LKKVRDVKFFLGLLKAGINLTVLLPRFEDISSDMTGAIALINGIVEVVHVFEKWKRFDKLKEYPTFYVYQAKKKGII